jgi:hypothetical protein
MVSESEFDLQKKDYLFFIERLMQRFRIPFLRGITLFAFLTFTAVWLTAFLTGLVYRYSTWDIYNVIMWTWPATVTIVTTMYFSRHLRDKALLHINEVSVFFKPEEHQTFKRHLKNTFVKHYHITFPLIFSFLFAVPFQVYFLILRPWKAYWTPLYQYDYYRTLVLAIYGVIDTWLWLFFVLTLGYFSLGIAYILNELEKQAQHFSIEDIDKRALRPLSSLLMDMNASFLLGIAINLSLIAVAPVSWWAISEIVLFIASALMLFFVPLYNLHAVIVGKKNEALLEIRNRLWRAIKTRDSLMLSMEKDIEQRVEAIPGWPFNTKMLIELSGYVLIPILIWIVSYALR